jgi:2-oxoglutarate ferredoxin oxidoreductase subunit alpha
LRDEGVRAGIFRPITLWPFPARQLADAAAKLRALVVVELSAGQMIDDVKLAVEGRIPVHFHGKTGGVVPTPAGVVDALRQAAS